MVRKERRKQRKMRLWRLPGRGEEELVWDTGGSPLVELLTI